jgi:hypothetical protein
MIDLRLHNSRLSRRLARASVAVALVLGGVLGGAAPALASLPGSTFEGNDGNLVVNTPGNADWVNAPNRVRGDDLPSGRTDNSFGQGTKEDDASVTVVTGSIPPNKSDLTRFYVASEFANGSNFLYLAWARSNVLGSANMDFEINKLAQPGLTTEGPKSLNRSPGDLLITFDFTQGGGNPVLGLLRWVTSGPTSQCLAANALPCWGNRVDLSGLGEAEGAVNEVAATDPIANVGLPALTFGEASVNLTAAGVFPPGVCTAFGSAFLKSRSSASFPSEVKDFVAPQPVNISNCGKLIVKKVTEPSPDPTNTSFGFTAGGGLSPTGFSLKNGEARTYDDVFAGSGYSVAETVPANWELVSATCDDGSPVTNISVSPNETVTCTFTNRLLTGAIKVTKTRKHAAAGPGDQPQAGVTFTVNGVAKQTDANGIACFDGLLFGTYNVTETVPAGYSADATTLKPGTVDKPVTVDTRAGCADNPYLGESVSFHNTPLTNVTISVDSQVAGGTFTVVECSGTALDFTTTAATGGDGSKTASDVLPTAPAATFTCTITIDP